MEIEIRQITTLKREQFKELEDALMSAFPSYNNIKRMYRYTFGKNLDLSNSETLVYSIIEQAEASGKINQLIKGAFKENPENPKLIAFIASIKLQKTDSKQRSHIPVSSESFKYFKPSVLINDITSNHIMDLRADNHKDFYYEREFDDELLDIALAGENILLLGNSLAGKTRAIYELIKKIALHHPDTNIIFPENIPIKKAPIKLPLKEGYRNIAFIEDIDDHYKNDKGVKKRYDEMIKALVRGKVQIFATCRTGPEYKEFKRLSISKVREVFRKIMVGKVKREIVLKFDESIIGNIEQSEFDGNIGSIFMHIHKMRDRYDDLINAKTDEADIAIKIMRALKTFYFASNFTRKSAYDAEAIKDYCLRLCVSKNASPKKLYNNTIVEQFANQEKLKLSKEIEIFNKKLTTALMLLESDEENLNFIRQESNRLEVEEVYLEKIVKYSPFKIIEDIDKLYDAKGEKKINGFYVKTNNYNKLLKDLSYYAAKNLFYEMRSKRIMPNADSFSFLIEKAETYEKALEWFRKLEDYGIPPNESVLLTIINKANDFEEAYKYVESILDLLKLNGKKDSDIDYQYQFLTDNILSLNEEISMVQVEQYLEAFQERLIPISLFVFNKIISRKIKNLEDTNIYLKWIQLYQIEPDVLTLNLLFHKSSSVQEALDLLDKEPFNKILVNENSLYILFKKSPSIKESIGLLKKEPFNMIPVNGSSLNILLEKSTSLKEALDLLDNEPFNKVSVSEISLNILIQKSPSLKEALGLLKKEPFNKIPFSESSLNMLLQKSPSLKEALAILDKEPFNSVTISDDLLVTLIQKSHSLQEALDLLDKEPLNKIPASEIILNVLLKKSLSLQEGLDLLKKEQFNKVSINGNILNTLLEKSPSLQEALELLNKEPFSKVPINGSNLNTLLERSTSLQEALDLLDKEPFNKVVVNGSSLNTLLEKSTSLQEALDLLDKELFNNITLSESSLNILIKKPQTTEEVNKVINLITTNKIKMNDHFIRQIPNGLSFYKSLLSISYFWDNYKLLPEFSYIDYSPQSFEDTISYFKDFEYSMTKFSWNHLIFLLIDNKLIKNAHQKDEIIKWFNLELKALHDRSLQDIIWNKYLFPDIKEMWDNYKFPTD